MREALAFDASPSRESSPRSMQRAFVEATQILRQAGIATPELDARLLLCHAACVSHEAYIARAREALPPDAEARLDDAIARRLKREPVARITGMREFYGRRFALGPAALDPRPDTETLIEAALDLVPAKGWQDKPLKLLDLGTGSGAILITLLAELPRARGVGTDLCTEALRIAADNARAQGVASRASFIAGDWLEAVRSRFDLVLSNPPYLATGEIGGLSQEVAGFDPHLALDGGPDGLEAYRRIAERAGEALTEDGRLLVEIGPAQAGAVADILKEAGLHPEGIGEARRDLAGRPRVVVAGPGLASRGRV